MNYYNCKNYFAFVFSVRCFSLKKKTDLLIITVKIFEFYSTVCDYHDFQKYWEPLANQQFDSAHEVDNPYDYFEIKTCTRGRNGRTVRYSPMEISRPTKYILQRGATVVATFLSSNYRRNQNQRYSNLLHSLKYDPTQQESYCKRTWSYWNRLGLLRYCIFLSFFNYFFKFAIV